MSLIHSCFLALLLFLGVDGREKRQSAAVTARRNEIDSQAAFLRSACHNKPLDLVFIIDSSRSVRPADFEKVKEFLITMLKFLDIGPDTTRVGLLQYGSTVKNEFSLKMYKRKSDIERAVKRMMHLATGTMTGLAIQYAMNIAFSEAEGARPLNQYVPRIAMIVTDGRPQDPVEEISAKARMSGILIFAIGVGRVDMSTLKTIGSEPHSEHVFLVANFSQIETLTSVFQNKLCAPHLCSTAIHGCDHFCINTQGSYICQCKQGYVLNPDEKTCSTQDLCATEKHGCEQICVNTPGSYLCQCYEAYELARDGKSCTVSDYCALGNHGCQHECINVNDSYVCQCRPGFILNQDKKTCRRPDYCAMSNHGCQHECVNNDDSFVCKCRSGFSLNPDKKTCRKINHCALGRNGCQHECVNTDNSFICRCHKGYTLNQDGRTCRKVDRCAETSHGCQHICMNTDDSFICQCYEGFLLNEDLKTCRAVDHCASNNHDCEHLCVNTEGSYTCHCFEGYDLRDDKKTCKSRDLCKSLDHGCEHICVNSDNSYLCKCFEEYSLGEDGKSCKSGKKCGEGPVDLVFVIDGSKSLGEDNFEIVKQFVNGILDSLEISQKAARVGLIQYSTHVRMEFTMAQYSSAKEVKKAVSQIKYMGRGSMTGLALKLMHEKSFSEAQGARPRSMGVPRVAIVFTDGRAQDEVSEYARKAKQSGITIYAIGVGKAIDEELQEIASAPQEKHVIYAEDFSAMGYITEKLKSSICEGWSKNADISNSEFSSELKSGNSEVTVSCSMSTIKLTTQAEGGVTEDECKCKNVLDFQSSATEEVKRLKQQLVAVTQRLERLERKMGQQ
ncbi:matrilin-2 isoform X1 [Xenopus laevis]|uniref:Matrilin-2 isoform X1 n=1 Tax=Xenopus laevis TaxID=8355 RepID=A0A8J1KYV5_XENLA|nr:matrilin-2 isoform X1 [Xenopus laevis]